MPHVVQDLDIKCASNVKELILASGLFCIKALNHGPLDKVTVNKVCLSYS